MGMSSKWKVETAKLSKLRTKKAQQKLKGRSGPAQSRKNENLPLS